MSRIMSLIRKLKSRRRIVIHSAYGIVSESARKQAALNMKADPVIKLRVEEILIDLIGDEDKALAESHRRYPEAYE